MDVNLRNFLEIPYETLEALNVKAKERRMARVSESVFEKEYREQLKSEKRIKAVTLCFSDIEGRFHTLDYDKKHFLSAADTLTIDGSSIHGFTSLGESDLRLAPHWSTMRWLPADIFGPGKVLMFAFILNQDRTPHESDFRATLASYMERLQKKEKLDAFAAPEIEGILVEGIDAEQTYNQETGFRLVSTGGYFHALPKDRLRQFMDMSAEAHRALGFQNEKDHPEVAPSQFELNFRYCSVLEACDQIQLYKLVCRQVATSLGLTATFLPKPVRGINGNGMHMNVSLQLGKKNAFYAKTGKLGLSVLAHTFINRLLHHAPEICLILNSSVNGYRRLDPNFEAPNQIKMSPTDRGSMIRIPIASPESTRIEIRSVAPDANPYLALYTIIRTGLEGAERPEEDKRPRVRFLPGTMSEAIRLFRASEFMEKLFGEELQKKFASIKQQTADRSPRDLGAIVKTSEIIYHHEVTNQVLWHRF